MSPAIPSHTAPERRPGLKNFLDQLRTRCRRRSVPEEVAQALSSEDPSMAGTASDILHSDTADILEQRASWVMEIDALRKLNTQSQGAAVDMFYTSGLLTPEIQKETRELLKEADARREAIVALRAKVRLAEAMLAKRRVSFRTSSGTFTPPQEREHDDCQFCFSSPPQVQFKCCGYKGACSPCARRMLRDDPRCPHCRSDRVAVRRLKQ
jgi:hypothetical protein